MGFADDWKTAKTAFENSTKAKKPSDSFLGVFKKGSGIESALKDADKAKTVGDLKKAVEAFKKASGDYTTLLDKSINDPKAVASDAKKAYADASKTLKAALEKILASALATVETLANADKKTVVDPAVVRRQTEALKAVKEHVALRQRVFLELTKYKTDFSKRGSEVESDVKLTLKHLGEAKASKSQGDTMQADVSAGVVQRFAESATSKLQAMQTEWDHYARQGGDLMKARGDNKSDYTDLAPEHAHYRQESNSLFGEGDKIQQDLQKRMGTLRNLVNEAQSAAEEAEQYQLVGAGPQVHAKRAKEVADRAEALKKQLAIRLDKAEGLERMLPTLKQKDQKGKEQTIGIIRTVLAKHAEDIKEMAILSGRLKNIPESALEDRQVSDLVNLAKQHIADFGKDAKPVLAKNQAVIKELGG